MNLPTTFQGPSYAGHIVTALQLFVTATTFKTETNPETRARYSKFSQANGKVPSATWPSRFAMMVIYTPALLTSLVFLLAPSVIKESALRLPRSSLATAFCAIHFAKRCLEVLFLHSYSGRTDRATPSSIGVYYALTVVLVAFANVNGVGKELGGRSDLQRIVGSTIFAIGLLGNFYHHYLLAKLRSSNAKSKYVAPKGGLFEYVACPHYLFELVGWLGIAIVSHHLNVYLVVASMSSYLGGRSVAQNEFNRKTFDERDWPRSRKNIVPFLF
ncbi:hypothetical protein HJC23_004211 [Cyclotella cryptica]|uniref:3-oxo-5-alpha-steroid 4-dehydrogenase C-terminal domain-containing protein n=1 Tax=Cyclotella cryptica TaxID=29204 RepID=A0ABD3Q8U1_9STRA